MFNRKTRKHESIHTLCKFLKSNTTFHEKSFDFAVHIPLARFPSLTRAKMISQPQIIECFNVREKKEPIRNEIGLYFRKKEVEMIRNLIGSILESN